MDLAARQTYDDHAPTYDLFLRDYNYVNWTTKLLALAEDAGLIGNKLLDVGCGTGLSMIVPLDKGFEVSGCDLSPQMVEVAKGRVGDRARLEVADMRQLPQLGSFDLVWAINDAINYLLGWQELIDALTAMAKNLGPNGLLLFDLNTMQTFKTFFCERHVVENQDLVMTWDGMMQPWQVHPTSICQARYSVEGKETASTIHRQRHFPVMEVRSALEIVGLELVGVFGEIDGEISQPLDEYTHSKAVYLARKL
jgi:SAM-dependent methyltransferase